MKITLEESALYGEPEIVIRCREVDEPMKRIVAAIRLASGTLVGRADDASHVLNAGEVFYFEAVDGRVFIYTEKKVYETPLRLYEIEARFEDAGFFRASKSVVANLEKIERVQTAFNGRFEARLRNGERIIISRQYVPVLKKKLEL